MRKDCVTYVVQVGLHVDQSESLLEEHYENAAWNTVLIKAVFVHVRLLRKHERRVFKACTHAQIRSCPADAPRAAFKPKQESLGRQSSLRETGEFLSEKRSSLT